MIVILTVLSQQALSKTAAARTLRNTVIHCPHLFLYAVQF